ncbi:MAG TPA: Uma2 family endonuclease, partial [Planctomycetaceae bacterium]|nr:Uma2 family endonuclease [Planctomycetaceae bacterium]
PSELPSGTVKYELDQGRLVLMAPPGDEHGRMQYRIAILLFKHAEALGLGEGRAEVGLILGRNPDRIVGPDAVFFAKRSLPVRTSPEGYLESIPDLVVEVRSKNDSSAELWSKAEEYLRAGVSIVWQIDPLHKTVTIFRQRAEPRVLRERDMLTAKGVIPGFKVAVAELFGS